MTEARDSGYKHRREDLEEKQSEPDTTERNGGNLREENLLFLECRKRRKGIYAASH
jgi:hypothetical protein